MDHLGEEECALVEGCNHISLPGGRATSNDKDVVSNTDYGHETRPRPRCVFMSVLRAFVDVDDENVTLASG
jgi:hypothetical protein